MSTNQLDTNLKNQEELGTKENPIYISSVEELKTLKTRIYYKYNCKICGVICTRLVPSTKERKESQYRLLCKQCGTKQTNLEIYGVDVPAKSKDILQKMQSTCIERYGVINPGQSKEVQERMKLTCQERYGTDYTFQAEIVKEKIKKSCIEKYGVENGGASKQAQEKIKNTCQKRYGQDSVFKVEPIKNKINSIIKDKYGVNNISELEIIKNKKKETLYKNYGVTSTFLLDSSKETMLNHKNLKYKFNNEYFDSSWELAFYVYYIDNNISIIREPKPIPYVFNNKKHLYYPDFEVNGQFYEIKGNQFFKEDGTMQNPYDSTLNELYEAKHQCGIQNNVIFITNETIKPYITYMNKTYGKNWKDTFMS